MSQDFNKLQAVFLDAVKIEDPIAREAWLAEACAGDADLGGRVKSLLAAAASPHPLLESPRRSDDEEDATAFVPKATPGIVVAGRYKLLEQIGEGGMGLVWMAEQRSPVRRLVAVKLIKAGMDSRAVLARFEAERQALAMMDHPSIARVFDGGATDRGMPWFAMELVRGLPVTEYCDQRRMPIAERLTLFMQICSAVQHAHQKGIIHRDLKPSNVLVTEHDGRPLSKIIDFGLAKALGGSTKLTDRTLYTTFGTAAGTPLYMAPEQVAINALDVDTRADVYALGVLLYELLTGTTPLERKRVKEAAWDELRRIIREEEPPRPSLRISSSAALPSLAATRQIEPAKLSGLVRGDLDWIVLKALEKDRNRRYDTAAGLAADISRHLANEPVTAVPPSLAYRAQKIWRKHRGPLAAAASLFGVLIAATVIISGLALRLNQQVGVATAALNEAKAEREKAVAQSYLNGIAATQNAIEGNNWPEARQRLDECPVEKRGWEWDYLRVIASAPMFGLSDIAWRCKLNPDGRYLLTDSNDHNFALVDLQSRKTIFNHQGVGIQSGGYYGSYPEGALSIDGHVAIQNERKVNLFDAAGNKTTLDLNVRGNSVNLQFSPRGTYLIVRIERDVHLYRVADGKLAGRVAKLLPNLDDFEVSHDERWIVVESSQGKLTQHEISGTRVRDYELSNKSATVWDAAFSPDDRSLVVGTDKGQLFVFDTGTGQLTKQIDTGPVGIEHLDLDPGGIYALVDPYSDGPNQVAIWDIKSGERLADLTKNSTSPRFTSDGEKVVGFADGSIWTWRAGSTAFERPTGDAAVSAYSYNGEIAVSIDGGRVRVWDTSQPNLQPMPQLVAAAEHESEGLTLQIGSLACPLSEWGPAVQNAAAVLAESNSESNFTATSASAADDAWQARCTNENSCEIFDRSGNRIAALTSHGGPVRAIVRTLDGRRLITGGNDGTIRFWDTRNWTEVATFRVGSPISGMLLSQDGTRLIVTFPNSALLACDIRTAAARNTADRALAQERAAAAGIAEARLADESSSNIASDVLNDRSMNPMRRVAVLAELGQRIAGATTEVELTFNRLKQERQLKQVVEEELAAMQLSKAQRVRANVLLEAWEQTPGEIHTICIAIVDNPKSTRELVMKANAILKEMVEKEPRISTRLTLAATEFRLGNYDQAVQLSREGNSWTQSDKFVNRWASHSRNMAHLAMAEHHLRHHAEARHCLREALRYWYGNEPFTELQLEAAKLVCPSAIDFTPPPHSDAWTATEAIDAADLEQVEEILGEDVSVKGRVARVSPTNNGHAANIALHPVDKGVLLWIRFEPGSNLDWEYAKSLEGQEIIVRGAFKPVPDIESISPWAKGRRQAEILSRDQIQVIGDPTAVKLWWMTDGDAPAKPGNTESASAP